MFLQTVLLFCLFLITNAQVFSLGKCPTVKTQDPFDINKVCMPKKHQAKAEGKSKQVTESMMNRCGISKNFFLKSKCHLRRIRNQYKLVECQCIRGLGKARSFLISIMQWSNIYNNVVSCTFSYQRLHFVFQYLEQTCILCFFYPFPVSWRLVWNIQIWSQFWRTTEMYPCQLSDERRRSYPSAKYWNRVCAPFYMFLYTR